jgi:hypothetical protein
MDSKNLKGENVLKYLAPDESIILKGIFHKLRVSFRNVNIYTRIGQNKCVVQGPS